MICQMKISKACPGPNQFRNRDRPRISSSLPHRCPHISGNKQNLVSAFFNTPYHFGPRIPLKRSYVRNWGKHGTTVTIETAPKELVDLVDGTSDSFEQPQRAMVDGIPPFSLPYQYMFCSIITGARFAACSPHW